MNTWAELQPFWIAVGSTWSTIQTPDLTTKVEIGQLSGFALDDPERGVLDNLIFTLSGLEFVDVTDRMQSISISRGKNKEIGRFNAGSLDVTFNNEDRFFDPVSGAALNIVPRSPVRVSMGDLRQFEGSIDDWGFDYSTTGRSKANLRALEKLQFLGRQNVVDSGIPPAESTGERVERVLDMFTVDWPADRRLIDTGDNTVCSQEFDGENALEYLQLVEVTEQGQLFIGKNGDLVFKARSSAAPRSENLVTFSDDDSGISYTGISFDYGTETMINRAIVSSPSETATSFNELSEQQYGIIQEEIDTLCSSESQLQNIADFLVSKFSQPELRFNSLTVNLDTLTIAEQMTLLDLEIGDTTFVTFTPNNVGEPIGKFAQIIRINHSQSIDRRDITFGFDSLEFAPLVLDDAVFGRLNSARVGF